MLDRFSVYAVLPSQDLDRARAWYRDHLGMEPETEDPGGLWYRCAGDTWFVVTRSAFAGTAQNTAAGFHVEHIEETMSDLRDRGVVFEEYDLPDFKTVDGLFTFGGSKAAWFKDCDGNIIEVAEVG
jgi:catechol 2,3-dioxygenase-like lactoylglutathione lyase family enzyme